MKLHTNTSRGLARWLWPWLAYLTCWLSKKKITESGSVIRRKEKHGRQNDSFPCVCAPPFMFTLILCNVYSIYFDDKRLKFMLLQNEICLKKSSRLFFLWTTNEDSYLTKHKTSRTFVFTDIQTCACCWIGSLIESTLTAARPQS